MNEENEDLVGKLTISSSKGGGEQDQGNNKKHKKEGREQTDAGSDKVPFHKLFAFADATDKALMIIGSIGAIGNGVCEPLMTILLGDLIDAFGQNQDNNKHIVHIISQVCPINVSFNNLLLELILICLTKM